MLLLGVGVDVLVSATNVLLSSVVNCGIIKLGLYYVAHIGCAGWWTPLFLLLLRWWLWWLLLML